jgi:hypothetical protein
VIKKEKSNEFQQASNSDSDFEYIDDDFIDEEEEFGGASRAVKLSIKALNFNMMIADKNQKNDPGTLRRVSLLSRASSLVASSRTAKDSTDRSVRASVVK